MVQVGDILDRGDDEIAILILLQKLHKQAEMAGGAVYILNGRVRAPARRHLYATCPFPPGT